jgi:hypothetical protein
MDLFASPRRKTNPLWWGLAAFFGLASAGLFAASQAVPALGLAAAAVAVLVAVLVRQSSSTQATTSPVSGNQHGHAPYASAQAAFNEPFVNNLEQVLEELRDAATQEDWVFDWSKINLATARAIERAKQKDYIVSIREYCRAICMLMNELRHQRKTKA